MGRQAQQVDALGRHVDGQMACGLNRVGVEGDAFLPAQRADFSDGLDGADFIVGKHDGHQGRVGPDGLADILHPDQTVVVDVQQLHLESLLLQALEGVEDGVVFKLAGNDMFLTFFRTGQGRGADGLVVGLAAAGGEVDLRGRGTEAPGDGFTGFGQRLRRRLTEAVGAGGVAVNLIKIRQHSGFGRGTHSRGGCIVSIYSHVNPSFLCGVNPICFLGISYRLILHLSSIPIEFIGINFSRKPAPGKGAGGGPLQPLQMPFWAAWSRRFWSVTLSR